MMSHGHSFKTLILQKHTRHVLVITQMKVCFVQMGIPVSCTGPSGITKESIYGILLGVQPQSCANLGGKKCHYQSGQWLWKLCVLAHTEVLTGTHMELIHLSLDAFLINEIAK